MDNHNLDLKDFLTESEIIDIKKSTNNYINSQTYNVNLEENSDYTKFKTKLNNFYYNTFLNN